MNLTYAEFDAFINDSSWWHHGAFELHDCVLAVEESPLPPDTLPPAATPPDTPITILHGQVTHPEFGDISTLRAWCLQWRTRNSLRTIVIKLPAEKVAQHRTLVEDLGGLIEE